MTPREKAEDLFNHMSYFHITDNRINRYASKQCALIAVDKIEEALTDYGRGDSFQLQNMDSEFRFWEQVKTEIEKL